LLLNSPPKDFFICQRHDKQQAVSSSSSSGNKETCSSRLNRRLYAQIKPCKLPIVKLNKAEESSNQLTCCFYRFTLIHFRHSTSFQQHHHEQQACSIYLPGLPMQQ